jgi:thiamine-monophosphate kinase
MTDKFQNESDVLGRIERAFGTVVSEYRHSLSLSIGDDAALFKPSAGCETILTCDWFLEGTHFLRDKHPQDAVGWKCLARAVSDIAAMGGVPRCFLLSLAIAEPSAGRWLDGFLGGLRRAARQFDCALAGGDTTRRGEILINVTVVGEVRVRRAVRRSGARPGDIIYVSGKLGEAEAGLRRLRATKGRVNSKDPLLKKHLYPEPRLALGAWLGKSRLATAMMDLSDGLSSDLPRLCVASGVGARIEARLLPAVRLTAADARHGSEARRLAQELALHGGDDYELLFTVNRKNAKGLPKSYEGVALTAIGEITSDRRILLMEETGRRRAIEPGGWDPFRAVARKKSGH